MSAWDSQFLLNGEVRTSARVDEFQTGLIGSGIFTTFAVYGRKPFGWEKHWARLSQNAERVAFEVPEPPDLEALLVANGRQDAKVKICLLHTHHTKTRFLTMCGALPDLHCEVHLRTTSQQLDEERCLVGVKSMSYGEYLQIHPEGSKSGSEVLVSNRAGYLCEGTYSNVFVIRDGKVKTPPLRSGCLGGVTRQMVIDITHDLGVPCLEEDIPYEELQSAEDIFLTSSLQGVQKGYDLDGKRLSAGPLAGRIQVAYQERLAQFRKDNPPAPKPLLRRIWDGWRHGARSETIHEITRNRYVAASMSDMLRDRRFWPMLFFGGTAWMSEEEFADDELFLSPEKEWLPWWQWITDREETLELEIARIGEGARLVLIFDPDLQLEYGLEAEGRWELLGCGGGAWMLPGMTWKEVVYWSQRAVEGLAVGDASREQVAMLVLLPLVTFSNEADVEEALEVLPSALFAARVVDSEARAKHFAERWVRGRTCTDEDYRWVERDGLWYCEGSSHSTRRPEDEHADWLAAHLRMA